jgi:hypothetical protein
VQSREEVMDGEVVQVEGAQKIGAFLDDATRGLAAVATMGMLASGRRDNSRDYGVGDALGHD